MSGDPIRDESEKKLRKCRDSVPEPRGSSLSPALSARDRRRQLAEDTVMQSTEAICQLYLQGYSFMEIAKVVSLSSVTVRQTIEESRKLWIERHDRALSDLVAEQVAKIDRVESRAWESYEESRKQYIEQQSTSGSNDKGTFHSNKKTKRKQIGSAEFLNIILNCVRQRSELLGLNKKTEDDTMRHNSMLVVVNSPEEARAIQDYQQFQKLVDGSVVSSDDQ